MNPLKLRAIIAVLLSLGSSSIQAEIISMSSMNDVQKKIELVLQNTKAEDVLVAFDIDMTLTQPDHPAVYYPTLVKYRDSFKSIIESLTPEQRDIVNTLLVQTTLQRLVEKATPQIVKNIQAQGLKVIAFTATLTGKFSKYKGKTIFLRRDQLQKKDWILQGASLITQLVSPLQNSLYMQGVIPCFIMGFCPQTGNVR